MESEYAELHLHVTHRIQAETLWNTVANDFQDLTHRLVGVGGFDKIEVGFRRCIIQLRQWPRLMRCALRTIRLCAA